MINKICKHTVIYREYRIEEPETDILCYHKLPRMVPVDKTYWQLSNDQLLEADESQASKSWMQCSEFCEKITKE
jgi:hypothetical protein